MRRGEVWWADLPPPAGPRPVVLVSRNEAYAVRAFVTVAQVTTRVRGLRVEVALGPEDGLDRPCVANMDTLNTIAKSRLQRRIATLRPEKLKEVEVALRYALGFG